MMAQKLNFNQIKQIFQTGGDPKGSPPSDPRKPGVIRIPSRFDGKSPDEALRVTMQPRKTVLVLTPFMTEDTSKAALATRFAKRATQDSIKRGEAPICSQLFFYDTMNMNVPIERDIGLLSLLSWIPSADLLAVYGDFGITQAMQIAINVAKIKSRKIEYRLIGAAA